MPKFKPIAILATVLLSLTPITPAKGKERNWEPGTLLDTSTERGQFIHGNAYGVNSYRDDLTFYKIDSSSMEYVCARTLRNRRDKPLDITINRPVQFAIEGSNCYLQDEEGKEHKLSVEQKIAK